MLSLIRRGDISSAVVLLQTALNQALGTQSVVDGAYGPGTEQLVSTFQAQHGLTQDGICSAPVIQALRLDLRPRPLGENDIANAAKRLGVTVPHVKAVYTVESRGKGFLPDGRVIILFERHQYYKRFVVPRREGDTAAALIAKRAEVVAAHPNICHPTRGGYQGGAHEWDRINLARKYCDGAALEAASWGLFQIMGFHAKTLGYPSVQSYVRAMEASEGDQLEAFCRFVLKDPRLLTALRKRDWASFALFYNGAAYRDNQYDTKLATAFLKAGGR